MFGSLKIYPKVCQSMGEVGALSSKSAFQVKDRHLGAEDLTRVQGMTRPEDRTYFFLSSFFFFLFSLQLTFRV